MLVTRPLWAVFVMGGAGFLAYDPHKGSLGYGPRLTAGEAGLYISNVMGL